MNRENVGEQKKRGKSEYRYTKKRGERFAYLRSIGEQNKEKTFRCIALSEPTGKNTHELTEDMGLHRDTIYALCKELINHGLLTKNGKFGKYHLTDKALSDPILYGWNFGRKALDKIHDLDSTTHNKFCNIDLNNIEDNYLDELTLFHFANSIGAFIIYAMIESFSFNKTAFKNRDNEKERQIKIQGKKRAELVQKWINNAISPTMMLRKFCDLSTVKRGLKKYQPFDPSWSFYEMDEDNFMKLKINFKNIYPDVYEQLENVRNRLVPKRN